MGHLRAELGYREMGYNDVIVMIGTGMGMIIHYFFGEDELYNSSWSGQRFCQKKKENL